MTGRRLTALALAVLLAAPVPLAAQPPKTVSEPGGTPEAAAHIILDKIVPAGPLVFFQSLDDEKAFYYVSDEVHLATDDEGRPQFSFLRWVENVRSGAAEAEAREGGGGGIVHALVELGPTPEELREAQRELRRVRPGARVAGPVPFTSGKFHLVSSFADDKGGFSTKVLGTGNAPLLDGQKAAVSILLTKLGAKVLWESFDMPTPDVSFAFEMDIAGYRSPIRALIEANFDQIYRSESFSVGAATTWFAGDINGAFDQLRRDGAIKVTQIGSDSALDLAVKTAYDALIAMMFEKTALSATELEQLAKSGESMGQLAAKRLKEDRDATKLRNDTIDKENEKIRQQINEAEAANREAEAAKGTASTRSADATAAKRKAERLRGEAEVAKADMKAKERLYRDAGGDPSKPASSDKTEAPKTKGEETAKKDGKEGDKAADKKDDKSTEKKDVPKAPAEKTKQQKEEELFPFDDVEKAPKPATDLAQLRRDWEDAKEVYEEKDKAAKEAEAEEKGLSKSSTESRLAADEKQVKAPAVVPELKAKEALPELSIAATYKLKKVKQSGRFVIDLNKYKVDTVHLRFDENIGDLRQYKRNPEHFREVNLDDPLYRQREIVAMVDGPNAQDFGSYINFVTVQLRKRHAGGAETTDEVRIDRKNFNSEGNAFKLLYGWDGDGDRRRWLEYEYRAVWSFFGGVTIEQPWQKTTTGAIALTPSFQRRTVTLEADPETIAGAKVRSITTKVFYRLGEREQVKQVTLNVAKQELSGQLEFLAPPDVYDYGYEVLWRLEGNRTVTSGRRSTNEAILFVDELPAG